MKYYTGFTVALGVDEAFPLDGGIAFAYASLLAKKYFAFTQ